MADEVAKRRKALQEIEKDVKWKQKASNLLYWEKHNMAQHYIGGWVEAADKLISEVHSGEGDARPSQETENTSGDERGDDDGIDYQNLELFG